MAKSSKPAFVEVIQPVEFTEALSERYLAYAMSTIMSRSLPDVRDGLKPVHRRLLFAMLQLKLDPKSGFKKCARVVGDVIGKYHPHGDVAVYDTMVRLAQGFSMRYPLVEGQGNFGSVDGDNAAAMRYTEARLTDVALALMADLDMDTVDFRPTYDGSEEEPVVFPSAFPNLLANGSEGIAVGMATSIPPHNVGEICDALLYLIKQPNARIETLCGHLLAPDFPTGGVLVESRESILHSYETGRGSFRLRARWEKEELSHGQYQIIITEVPYMVPKSRLIEKMADMFREKKLVMLGDIRDESAEDIRIVLEPKSKNVDAAVLMESLFKMTDLETRISLNMNVLDAQTSPRVMNIKEILQAFLDHRQVVLVRRSKFRLGKIDHRLEVLEGFLIAYLNIDAIIKIIRNEDEPKPIMMKKFGLTDVQAEAILNMRLRSLRKLEEFELKKEHKELKAEKAELLALLKSEEKRWDYIYGELKEIKKKFGGGPLGKRRTELADAPSITNVSIEAFVEKEPITILCSKMGWIKALKGHFDTIENKYKEGDEERFILKGQTTDKLMVFTTDGKCFALGCDKLPSGRGFGEPVRIMIDLAEDRDIASLFIYQPDSRMVVASSEGKGFIVEAADMLAEKRTGKQVLDVREGESALKAAPVVGDMVAVIGTNRKLLVFKIDEIPVMKRGQGVFLQKYKDAKLSDIKTFDAKEGLSWSLGDRVRTEANIMEWQGIRASAGKLPPVGFPRNNSF
jgi:topoisomerase-4 subunit A